MQMSSACRRYQSDMAELSDQVRLLYREHSNSTASWQQKCNTAEKQVGDSALHSLTVTALCTKSYIYAHVSFACARTWGGRQLCCSCLRFCSFTNTPCWVALMRVL